MFRLGWHIGVTVGFVGLLVAVPGSAWAQQEADPTFDAKVAKASYTEKHPKVLFDEAHHNFHTTVGRYKPFVDLIKSDGYKVTANKEKFTKESLAKHEILVIANALGSERMGSQEASTSAFTDEECNVVKEWVEQGGCLLLIADHSPMGAAAEKLAAQFKVDMSKGYTFDEKNMDETGTSPTTLKFDTKNGLLADHPITRGRNDGERIKKVVTFTGQSLKGPKEAQVIFKLADSATDQVPPDKKRVSAAGRCQGLTLKLGKGRAVILGEAAFLSAQIVGPEKRKFGMNKPGIDNKQFALNLMHWLSGLIEDK